jgi:hypothetical protein
LKTVVRIFFGLRGRDRQDVRRILAAAGRQDSEDPKFPLYSFDFDAQAPQLDELRSALAERRIDWDEHVDYRFSDREIEEATLVYPELRRAGQGMGGPSYGTRFDLSSACPTCGTGARQLGPLKLKGYEIRAKGGAVPTLDHDWLFAEPVAARLGSFTGIELRQVEDVVSGERLPWFQALAEHELPPMHSETTGLVREAPCTKCGRDGYFHTAKEPLLIVYDGATVDPGRIPDVSCTFEHFGNSVLREPIDESHFGWALFVIKPAVAKALRDAKVRQLRFYPVSLLESAE